MAGLGDRFRDRFRDGYAAERGPPTPPIETRVEGSHEVKQASMAGAGVAWARGNIELQGFWRVYSASIVGAQGNFTLEQGQIIAYPHVATLAAVPWTILSSGEFNDSRAVSWSGELYVEGAWTFLFRVYRTAYNAGTRDFYLMVEKLHPGRGK